MTTYTAITNGQVDQNSPVTQTLMTALRDNPIAIAEQTAGAPPVGGVWHFYNETTFGAGDGVIYDFATDGAVAAVETPDFEAGYEYRIVGIGVRNTSGAASFRCALFQATAGSYATPGNITGSIDVTSFAAAEVMFDVYIPFPAVVKKLHDFQYRSHVNTTGAAAAVPQLATYATVNATAQAISKARITPSASNIGGGVIRLLRRRAGL